MNPEQLLPLVRKASRYCGNEFNVPAKEWQDVSLRYLLAFPDMYEIGMSHQGLQILYHIINGRSDLLAERVYAPDTDLEDLLRQTKTPLFSLESRHPLLDFDVLAFTLPYELCNTNILTILDLGGLPFYSRDRSEEHPLLLGGGPGAFHPEPVADFFDAILLGDGEEAIVEISDFLLMAKQAGWSRQQVLAGLAEIEGVYVPAFFAPQYGPGHAFEGIRPLKAGYEKVRRRVLPELSNDPAPAPLVPLNKIVHDRLGIEVARGCTRGCRFCQAGIVYRPVRERPPEQVLRLAKEGIKASGFEELALLSLSTGDYSCLSPLLVKLMDTFAQKRVSVSMPSMRVGTLTPEIMEQIKRVRKTGFTVAPEAGTDRLRQVLNKGITEEDLLATCGSAFSLGWKIIKFYFMFGLPTETQEDLDAIPELALKALRAGSGPGRRITVSAATFIPKPHTPFQWEPQLSVAEGFERIDFLKAKLRDNGVQLRWGDPRQSFLEGVFARGDRRLSALIVEAWQRGARFDAWNDHLRLDTWKEAAAALGVDLEHYLRRRDFHEPLPWDHLDCGVDPAFIRAEYAKAMEGAYTPDCRVHGCQKCGLCDFKTVFPRTCQGEPDWPAEEEGDAQEEEGEAPHFHYRLDYSRLGRARFLSHLELLQVFFRAFNRVGLPLHYSKGFNPSPKVSFSPALPLGTESRAEYLLLDLRTEITPQEWLSALNEQLPEGLCVQALGQAESKKIPAKVETCYTLYLPVSVAEERLASFMAAAAFPVTVTRKKKERVIDGRPQVTELRLLDEKTVVLQMISEVSKAALKPLEIMQAVLDLTEEELIQIRVVKEWFKAAC
ncbi:MAG: TIGR03960 family B12-binding radical SAM protein [Desulfurivibrionaceae bacterium]|nr:TIGR03960 family B12-binding radical SAM protein [Desulfurivibrionaceae bacterium]